MANKFYITNHAVQRYIDRHNPGTSYDAAKEIILNGLASGSRLKQKTFLGTSLWKFGDQNITAVVKIDDREIVCVTILPERKDESHNLSHPNNFDYEDEFKHLNIHNGPFIEEFQPSAKEEVKYFEEFKLALKAKYDEEITKLQIKSEEDLKKETIKIEVAVKYSLKDVRQENDELKKTLGGFNEEYRKLNEEYHKLLTKQEVCNERIDTLIRVMVSCLHYLNQKKNDPEILTLLKKIDAFDPSIMEYQSSFSSLILS